MPKSTVSPKSKIVFVSDAIYPYNKGGKEKRLYHVTQEIAGRGYDVHMFCMKWWEGPKVKTENGITLHGVCPAYNLYTKSGRRSIPQALLFSLALFIPLMRERFDLLDVDETPFYPLFVCKVVSLLKRKPIIATWLEVWGKKYWQRYLGKISWRFGYWTEYWAMKFPHHFSSISQFTTDRMQELFKIPAAKIATIPIGIYEEDFNNLPSLSKKADLIFVGRLIKPKNVELVLNTVKQLKEQGLAAKTWIVGDGPDKSRLEKLARKLDIDDLVSFLGFIEDEKLLFAHLKAAKILAFPSLREGFGLTVLEANACGLPAIVLNAPENASASLIKENQNGFVCSEKNFCDTIAALLSDHNHLEKLRSSSKKTAKSYNWDQIIDRLENLYKQFL